MQSYSYLHSLAAVRRRADGQQGVFARGDIARGELVALWGGTIYTTAEVCRMPGLSDYSLRVAEGLHIGPSDPYSLDDAEFFNHSCAPNCGIRGQVALVAMRDIREGEELTFDYAMSEAEEQPFECCCGAPSCRGKILAADSWDPQLRRRYEGFMAAWLA